MSFSISGPQSPHLLDDRVGLSYPQAPPALTHQDYFLRRVSGDVSSRLQPSGSKLRLPLPTGVSNERSDHLLHVLFSPMFSVTLLPPSKSFQEQVCLP